MSKGLRIAASLAAGLLLSVAVSGGEVYRWTDAQGVVHFSDRPDGADSEHVGSYHSTNGGAVEEAATDRQQRRETYAAAREEKAAEKDEAATAEAERRENCQMAKKRAAQVMNSRRLYDIDASGERRLYTAEETAAARAHVKAEVAKWCSNGKT